MTKEQAEKKFGLLEDFYRHNRKSRVYWAGPIDPEKIGPLLFSFDKKNVFRLFGDLPFSLTDKEVQIFCEDEPYWANFFRPDIEERGITF